MDLLQNKSEVSFDPEKHRYITDDGKELLPVTRFLSFFTNDFDPDNSILNRCSAREGIPPEVLKKRWEEKGRKSREIGHKFHENIEHYINTGKIRKNKFTNLVREFSKIKFQGKLYSELIVHDSNIGLSGTIDIAELIDDKILQIKDFKVVEKPITDYSFGQKMKPPLEYLWDSKLSRYSLQISIYLYLLSEKFNLQIGPDNCLFWVNLKKQNITKIPVKYMKEEVINMISYYMASKSNIEWEFD